MSTTNSDYGSFYEKNIYNKIVYLKKTKVISSKNLECPICLENTNNYFRKLCCCHSFHLKCIDLWLSKNNKCPMCRKKIYLELSRN